MNKDISAKNEQRVVTLWRRFGHSTFGRMIFNLLLVRAVPYSGSIRPKVLQIEDGLAKVVLKDKRLIRNHLNCIHAIALANLGELASGLALLSKIDTSIKAIVVNIEIDYIKKARGELVAIGKATPPAVIEIPTKNIVSAEITDKTGDVVARLRVHWLLSARKVRQTK